MKVNYNNHFFLLTPDLWEHDLALVRLSRSVPSGPKYDKIKRIILPSVDNASFPGIGDDCVMKGWGCKSGGEHFGILCICSIFLKFRLLFFLKMAHWYSYIHVHTLWMLSFLLVIWWFWYNQCRTLFVYLLLIGFILLQVPSCPLLLTVFHFLFMTGNPVRRYMELPI